MSRDRRHRQPTITFASFGEIADASPDEFDAWLLSYGDHGCPVDVSVTRTLLMKPALTNGAMLPCDGAIRLTHRSSSSKNAEVPDESGTLSLSHITFH
jgi:hypothetical protein